MLSIQRLLLEVAKWTSGFASSIRMTRPPSNQRWNSSHTSRKTPSYQESLLLTWYHLHSPRCWLKVDTLPTISPLRRRPSPCLHPSLTQVTLTRTHLHSPKVLIRSGPGPDRVLDLLSTTWPWTSLPDPTSQQESILLIHYSSRFGCSGLNQVNASSEASLGSRSRMSLSRSGPGPDNRDIRSPILLLPCEISPSVNPIRTDSSHSGYISKRDSHKLAASRNCFHQDIQISRLFHSSGFPVSWNQSSQEILLEKLIFHHFHTIGEKPTFTQIPISPKIPIFAKTAKTAKNPILTFSPK